MGLDGAGNLILGDMQTPVIFKAPVMYQDVNGERKSIHGKYVLQKDNQVGFEIETYDPNIPLVIDPVVDYSTYLGGINNDNAAGVAGDSSGNGYVTGSCVYGGFPTTSGSFQT